LHLDCVGSKSGIFRCVHGFDFGPSGFSFGFFTRALRPGPNSRRALGFLSFLFLPPLPKCAAVLLPRARVSSSSFRSAPPLGLGSSRQAVACAPPGCSPRVIRVLGFHLRVLCVSCLDLPATAAVGFRSYGFSDSAPPPAMFGFHCCRVLEFAPPRGS
jgi:hypothetical protein